MQIVPVDILKGDTTTPNFLRMNPMGQIPVLELADGTCLRESNAILFWLAEGTELLPQSKQEKTTILQWMFFEQSNVDKVLGRTRFLRTFPHFRVPAPHEWEEWYRLGTQALVVLDEHLNRNTFIVGDTYSIADISLYGYVHTANEGGYALAKFRNIERWMNEVESTRGYISQMMGKYP